MVLISVFLVSHDFSHLGEIMNKSRPRDREALLRLSNLRRKVGEGGRKRERSTKGLVCMHISLTNGRRQHGVRA